MSDNQVMGFGISWKEVIMRMFKYLVLGAAIATSVMLLPSKKVSLEEAIVIALSGACIFAILDLYSPSTSMWVKTGAGLSIGSALVGGIPIMM